jgi:hypothetical protein
MDKSASVLLAEISALIEIGKLPTKKAPGGALFSNIDV